MAKKGIGNISNRGSGKKAPMPGVGTGKVPKNLKMGNVSGPNKGKRGG